MLLKGIKDLLKETNSDKQSAHCYGFVYDLLFTKVFHQKGEKLNVLEIGVSEYGDGSLKAYALSEMVATAVGVDIVPYTGEMLENMRFHQLDAYTKNAVRYLEDKEGEFDIIIDDGSHLYEHQTFFLEHYGKLLRDGGLLICEDVAILHVINEQCAKTDTFMIDGWGNMGSDLNSFTDQGLYEHNERIIVRTKSEHISDVQRHSNKQHIPKLPVVPFKDYERHSTELAISVPLYHPDFPEHSSYKYKPDDFRSVHCKGAIWSAMAMLHNTDLADNGVPVYFHIEDKVWDDAQPVFDDFGVPKEWRKKMTLPDPSVELTIENKPQYGKSLMGLLDDEIDTDITMILDSDFFACVPGEKMKLYDRLTLPMLKSTPSMTYFKRKDVPYWWWISVAMGAAALPLEIKDEHPLNEIEQIAYEKLGFKKEKLEQAGAMDIVNRYHTDEYLKTFPREHPIRDFAIGLIPQCYCVCYALAMWSEYNQPILELDSILQIPVYDWEGEYIAAQRGDHCFAHVRVERARTEKLSMPSKVHQYYDRFFENVSRYVVGEE